MLWPVYDRIALLEICWRYDDENNELVNEVISRPLPDQYQSRDLVPIQYFSAISKLKRSG